MTKLDRPAYLLLSRVLLFFVLALILMPGSGSCESLRNYKIKAGFTYRFILFSEWPVSAFAANPDQFVVGIVGDSSFNVFFKQVLGTEVDGRKLVVRELSEPLNPEELRSCQVVFVHESEKEQVPTILKNLAGLPVLTISDADQFVESGGMIAFFNSRNRIRFAINRQRADVVNLSFRAQMLKMATHVVEGEND